MPNIKKSAIIFILIASLPLILPNAIFAQTPPPGAEPGAQEKRFETYVEEKEKQLKGEKAKPPEIQVEEKKAEPIAEGPAFVLKEIKITGATIFKPEDFRSTYQSYIGKRIIFKDMDFVIERIKAKYKEKGYLTTTAYVPEQEIRDGVIEVRVIEGKMGSVAIEGNRWFPQNLIKKYIHIKKNEVLNIRKLQRDILRLNQNPDVELKTVVDAGKEPGTSDITIKVKDYFPYHVGLSVDNQGSRLTGTYRAIFTVRGTDLTANNDSFFQSTLISRSANAQSISYTLPVDTCGAKLGLSYTHFHLTQGKEFSSFDMTGDTKSLSAYIAKELSLSEDFEANVSAGMDIKSNKKHTAGVTTADDQLRVPYLGFDFSKRDTSGQTSLSSRFNFGTGHFLGASSYNHPTASRRETGGFFFKYEETLTRIQRMFLESYCIIRAQLQLATHTLAPSEQFQIGGANSVRGYPEGDFLADTGGVLNLEWLFPMYLVPKDIKLPYSDMPLRNQIEPLVFLDLGGGRLNKAFPGERRDKFLAGIGGGLKIRLYKNISCKFQWAADIGAKPTSGNGPSTFHLSVQSEI